MTPLSLLDGVALPHRGRATPHDDLDVVRDPADVASHLRRVAAATGPDQTYGALVDLFIGSAAEDRTARGRALAEHAVVLRQDQRAALTAAVGPGLEASTPVPRAVHSLLTCGATSSAPLVVAAQATVPPTRSSDARSPGATSGPTSSATPAPASPTPPARRHRSGSRVPWVVAAAIVAVTAVGVVAVRAVHDEPAATPPSTASTVAGATLGADDAGTSATLAVDAAFAALAAPAASWDRSAFADGSPTVDAIDDLRRQLVAASSRIDTRVRSTTATDTAVTGTRARVTVGVRHDGSSLVTPEASEAWAAPGTGSVVVDLVAADGRWVVTTITSA